MLFDTSSVTHHHSNWFVNRLHYTEHLWSKVNYNSRDNLGPLSPDPHHAHRQHQTEREKSKEGEGITDL